MKHLLTTIGLFIALTTQAQKVDSVKNAIQVKPVLINALKKDTVYQVGWSVFGLNRNDTTGANSYVSLYDRKGVRISEMNIPIPYSVLSKWLDDVVIDDFIITFLGLQKR